jgi:hypothetical protein
MRVLLGHSPTSPAVVLSRRTICTGVYGCSWLLYGLHSAGASRHGNVVLRTVRARMRRQKWQALNDVSKNWSG